MFLLVLLAKRPHGVISSVLILLFNDSNYAGPMLSTITVM